MQVADSWLHRAGFMPGQRMRFCFDYRNACVPYLAMTGWANTNSKPGTKTGFIHQSLWIVC
jgi:hypothetical protein